jgi:hypothetical protein
MELVVRFKLNPHSSYIFLVAFLFATAGDELPCQVSSVSGSIQFEDENCGFGIEESIAKASS